MGLTGGSAAYALAVSMLLGMTLAAAADVLSPVRGRLPFLTDVLLCIWMVWIWLKIAFEICAGDLRTGYCAVSVMGALGWRKWISPYVRPLFVKLWKIIGAGLRIFLIPIEFFLKKMKKFRKKLFPTGEKWVTIGKGKMPK